MSEKPIVLVIDGMHSEGGSLKRIFDSSRCHAYIVQTSEDALLHVESPIDLVLSCIDQNDPAARELFQRWKSRRPQTPFVILNHANNVAAGQARQDVADGFIEFPKNGQDIFGQLSNWLPQVQATQQPREETQMINGIPQHSEETHNGSANSIQIPPGTTLEDLERAAVQQALAQHRGNRTHAAKELGISVRTLQRKLKAWGNGSNHAAASSNKPEPAARVDVESSRPWNANPAAPRDASYRPRLAKV